MSNEIEFPDGPVGLTVYALLMGRAEVYDHVGHAFVTPVAGNWANYVIAMAELAAVPGCFSGSMPAGVPEGRYCVCVMLRSGGAPASGDPLLGYVHMRWDGAAEVVLDDTLAAGDFTEPAIAADVAAIKGHTDLLPAQPSSAADVLALLDQDIDSTGAQAVTVRKAIEAMLAVLAGKADFDPQTGAEQFKGRDGATPIVTTQILGNGKRTASTIS